VPLIWSSPARRGRAAGGLHLPPPSPDRDSGDSGAGVGMSGDTGRIAVAVIVAWPRWPPLPGDGRIAPTLTACQAIAQLKMSNDTGRNARVGQIAARWAERNRKRRTALTVLPDHRSRKSVQCRHFALECGYHLMGGELRWGQRSKI
jgi:hypothetical protein